LTPRSYFQTPVHLKTSEKKGPKKRTQKKVGGKASLANYYNSLVLKITNTIRKKPHPYAAG